MAHRLLVIEDEPAIADFIVRGLREEGFTVEHSVEGNDAWHRLATETWDVILLDRCLPDMDGVNLLRRFRQSNVITPVLLLTARDSLSDRVTGLNSGADERESLQE